MKFIILQHLRKDIIPVTSFIFWEFYFEHTDVENRLGLEGRAAHLAVGSKISISLFVLWISCD